MKKRIQATQATATEGGQRPTLSLNVQWGDELDSLLPRPVDRPQLRRWIMASLTQDADITLRFVGHDEGLQLNHQFRGKHYATNVLTFPLSDSFPAGVLPTGLPCSADIVICWPVVEREAKDQGKALLHHLAHLVIHGCLHAQGHDHQTDAEAEIMESLETRLLKRFRIANPYQST